MPLVILWSTLFTGWKGGNNDLKPFPSPDSERHPWPDSTPHCRHLSSHTHLKEGLLHASMYSQWHLIPKPALAPCRRKSGQKAPNWNQRTIRSCKHDMIWGLRRILPKQTRIVGLLHHSPKWSEIVGLNLELWVFRVSTRVASDVSRPEHHPTHHHPLQRSDLAPVQHCSFHPAPG